MAKAKKLLASFMALVVCVTFIPLPAYAANDAGLAAGVVSGSLSREGESARSVPTNGWYDDDGWMCYYRNGSRIEGLQRIDGKLYYFGEVGSWDTGDQYGGYVLNDEFLTIGKKTYYFGKNGAAQSGWLTYNGAKYYFNPKTNAMVTGLQKIGKKKYYFSKSQVFYGNGTIAERGQLLVDRYFKGYIMDYKGICHKIKIKKTGNKTKDAKRVAKLIAKYCGPKSRKAINRVKSAASIVSDFCTKCRYTQEGEDYATAYGVFIAKKFSCAGSTRALGLVLSCMGFKWQHKNPNAWTHQWCTLKIKGRKVYADAFIFGGAVGYGKHPYVY